MLLDLVMVVPTIPCNFQQFDNKRGSPSLAGIALTKPEEVSFLNAGPFDSDSAFKKASQPIQFWLGVDSLEKAGLVGVRLRERLRALPSYEALDDPIGGVSRTLV